MKGTHLSCGYRSRGGLRGLLVVVGLVAYFGLPARAAEYLGRDDLDPGQLGPPGSCPGSPARRHERRTSLPAISPETTRACHLTAPELRRALSGRQPLVIDIRSSRAYERAHIRPAINILGDLVPHKSFLKHRDVVLVGEGYGSDQTLRLCERLRVMGVPRVRVLTGGIAGWIGQGYPFAGEERVPARLLALSPIEALAAAGNQNWIFVVDRLDGSEQIQGFADQPRVEFDSDVELLAAAVRAADSVAPATGRVLIVSKHPFAGQVALDLARRLSHFSVRFVDGGPHAFIAARAQQAAILERPDLEGRSLSRCGG